MPLDVCRTVTSVGISFVLLLGGQSSIAQNPRDILHKTAQRYQGLTQFDIEAVEVRTFQSEMSRTWEKKIYRFAATVGCRYHFEIREQNDWLRAVSDGVTEWTEQPGKGIYTSRPSHRSAKATAESSNTESCETTEQDPAPQARQYLQELTKIDERVQSVRQLPDEIVSVNSTRIACTVLQVVYDAAPNAGGVGNTKTTFWIDKTRQVIIKKRVLDITIVPSSASLGLHRSVFETLTLFPVVTLHELLPEELFHLQAKDGERLVDSLSNHWLRVDFRGQPAPVLKLRTLDGSRIVDLESFRGRPVLVNFWATWCWSCHQTMEVVGKFKREFETDGLVIVGVNKDEDPNTAGKYLADRKYDWVNVYDERSEATEAWGANALPLVALVDRSGMVIFYDASASPELLESGIRKALEKLGPSFKKPSSAP